MRTLQLNGFALCQGMRRFASQQPKKETPPTSNPEPWGPPTGIRHGAITFAVLNGCQIFLAGSKGLIKPVSGPESVIAHFHSKPFRCRGARSGPTLSGWAATGHTVRCVFDNPRIWRFWLDRILPTKLRDLGPSERKC